MDQNRMQKLLKYYHKMKACSQNSSKYKIYQQKIQYYLEGGVVPPLPAVFLERFTRFQNGSKVIFTDIETVNKKIINEETRVSNLINSITHKSMNVQSLQLYPMHANDPLFITKENTKSCPEYPDNQFKLLQTLLTTNNLGLPRNISIPYKPVEFTSPARLFTYKKDKPWNCKHESFVNDETIIEGTDLYNRLQSETQIKIKYINKIKDKKIAYQEYKIKYIFDKLGRPLNPFGLTGITGRGQLGKWGKNPSGDALVTRSNTDGQIEILLVIRKKVYNTVNGKKTHIAGGEPAIPGGMQDPGESAQSESAYRELVEETDDDYIPFEKKHTKENKDQINSINEQIKQLESTQTEQIKVLKEQIEKINEPLTKLLNSKISEIKKSCTPALEIFSGPVDDPRNTDNAWMYTNAIHIHYTQQFDKQPNNAINEETDTRAWIPLENNMNLYASHGFLTNIVFNLFKNGYYGKENNIYRKENQQPINNSTLKGPVRPIVRRDDGRFMFVKKQGNSNA